MGNIPPRNVLAEGGPADPERPVTEILNALDDTSRPIVSWVARDAPTENIEALITTVEELTRLAGSPSCVSVAQGLLNNSSIFRFRIHFVFMDNLI